MVQQTMYAECTNLSEKEVKFFYDLLYKYEHGSHAGYQDGKVLEEIQGVIELDDNYNKECNITRKAINEIKFAPYRNNKCWAIQYHIRNAFAHGNIKSVDNDTAFLIQDFSDKSKREKCNMLCYIEKGNLYTLIRIMEETRIRPKKSYNNRTK